MRNHLILIVKMTDIQIIQNELVHLIKILHHIVNGTLLNIFILSFTSWCKQIIFVVCGKIIVI
jgi:hypothetical protein